MGGDRLLVEERTDKAARLQLVELGRGSSILGSSWDDDTTSSSLEQLDDPAAVSVPVLAKRLVVDLYKVDGVQQKIEGIARVDRDTLALINDNDFGMTDGAGAFDAQGRLVDSGVRTIVTYVRPPEELRPPELHSRKSGLTEGRGRRRVPRPGSPGVQPRAPSRWSMAS